MASNIKRNKALVNSVSKSVINCYNSMSHVSLCQSEYIRYNFSDIIFEDLFKFFIYPKYNKVIAVEGKNKIYIGFDTSRIEKIIAVYGGDSIFDTICRFVYEAIWRSFSIYNSSNSNFKDDIVGRLEKDGDISLIKTDSNGAYDESSRTIEKTKLYKEAAIEIYDSINNAKFYIELKDGVFKEINNRKFMPVIVIDLEKQELDYCVDPEADTDRKRRNSITINRYMQKGETDFKTRIEMPVRYLTEVKVEGNTKLTVE